MPLKLMKDVIARSRIEGLDQAVRELKVRTEFCDPWTDPLNQFNPKPLYAHEIIKRFNELYELLGVTRETVPPLTLLKKKGETYPHE